MNNLSRCWTASGRPTVSLVMGQNMLENGKISAPMLSILKKLKEGKLVKISFLWRISMMFFDNLLNILNCKRSLFYLFTKRRIFVGPWTQIDAFQTDIFSWLNDIPIIRKMFLKSWDREIWLKKTFNLYIFIFLWSQFLNI